MNPPSQNSGSKRTVLLALGCLLFSIQGVPSMSGSCLPVARGDTHATQRGHVISHRLRSNSRNKFGEGENSATAYQGKVPAGAVRNEDMPACFFIEEDDSDEEGSAMADDSNDSSAQVHGLLLGNVIIAHAIGTREIIYQTKTWFPSVFQGIYQSGAAPPSGGTKENRQNIWIGGSGGRTAVALRIVGGELSQNTPEWLEAPEIRERAWREVAKYAAHSCLRDRVILQATACHFHSSNTLESIL